MDISFIVGFIQNRINATFNLLGKLWNKNKLIIYITYLLFGYIVDIINMILYLLEKGTIVGFILIRINPTNILFNY